jgi:MHS family proline/betaine transporter-like MFS transporter
MLAVFPAYWLASSGSLSGALLGVILLAVGALMSGVVTAALLSECFPTRSRYTASAITYNIAYTLFGGTAPLVATWLIEQSDSRLAPAFYLVAIALLALLGGLGLPETSRLSLHDPIDTDPARDNHLGRSA